MSVDFKFMAGLSVLFKSLSECKFNIFIRRFEIRHKNMAARHIRG